MYRLLIRKPCGHADEDATSASGREGRGQSGVPDMAPKGYKGDPSDTREDAFQRMQVGASIPFAQVALSIWSSHPFYISYLLLGC